MSGEELVAAGPVIAAAIGVGTRMYDSYHEHVVEEGDTGNKGNKCKKLFCCCISFLSRHGRNSSSRDDAGENAESGEVNQRADQNLRGGDDEDGIHYTGGLQFKPVLVCCGGVYKSNDVEEGTYIADRHESVNNSQRTLRNEHNSNVGRRINGQQPPKHLGRRHSSPGSGLRRSTTEL